MVNFNNFNFWVTKLIDEISEYQCEIAEEWFDQLATFHIERDLVDVGTDCTVSLVEGVINQPLDWIKRGLHCWDEQSKLLINTTLELLGSKPVTVEPNTDWRFRDAAWTEHPGFSFLRREYLLLSQQILEAAESLHDSDSRRHQRFVYFMRQWVNALAPSNFPLTNPEVLRATVASGGKNIVTGMQMLLADRKRSSTLFNVCMSLPNGFELGRDIAATPGAVIHENDFMQLIQYHPRTEQVARTPILLVPSWVNKYYILDLTPNNSFVRWLLEQGHTVFVISWINPDREHHEQSFADYITRGVLEAADTIACVTGERRLSALGYCLGGILLASTLAYCAYAGDDRFVSATYLAASVDFSNSGDMGMFINENMVAALEERMSEEGYLDGRVLASGFSLLRENDLFWSYYVNNYLKGERPPAHDLMHWNTDNTNVTAASHSFVLRELHLHNRLMQPDALKLHGRPIDLRRIQAPTYVLGTEKDHIAHWHSTYTATQLQSGPCRFVLAGSGHIVGVINPPELGKYGYFSYDRNGSNPNLPKDPQQWLAGATQMSGSWWTDWQAWQAPFAGGMVAARTIDPASVIEDAPGRYVRRRLDS